LKFCTAANASETGFREGELEDLATKDKLYEFTNRWLRKDAPGELLKVFCSVFHDETAKNDNNINYRAVAAAALCHHVSILKRRSPTEGEINRYWELTRKHRGCLRKKVRYALGALGALGKNPVEAENPVEADTI
jgi:hypothetical protein